MAHRPNADRRVHRATGLRRAAGRPVLLGAAGLAAAAALAACSPSQQSCTAANQDINLISLANNSIRGNYEACIAELRQELADLRLEANQLDARARQLNAQAAAADGERRARLAALAEANQNQAGLARDLSERRGAVETEEAALRALLAEEEQLEAELRALERGGTVREIEDVQRQQSALQSRIRSVRAAGG